MQGWNLVAQRFACAGRHDGERVVSRNDAVNDFALSRAQIAKPKGVSKYAFDLAAGSSLHAFQLTQTLYQCKSLIHRTASGTIRCNAVLSKERWFREPLQNLTQGAKVMTYNSVHSRRSAE